MDRFTRIWEAYHQPILRRLRRQVHDAHVAEDLLQDIFLTVFTHLDTVRQPDRLMGWIGRIARNRVIDYYRSQRYHEPLPEVLAKPEDENPHYPSGLAGCLPAMVAQLPKTARQAIELTTSGMSQAQLSKRLGISPSGTRAQVQRARARLKQQLLECCDLETDATGRLVAAHPKQHQCDGAGCNGCSDHR